MFAVGAKQGPHVLAIAHRATHEDETQKRVSRKNVFIAFAMKAEQGDRAVEPNHTTPYRPPPSQNTMCYVS